MANEKEGSCRFKAKNPTLGWLIIKDTCKEEKARMVRLGGKLRCGCLIMCIR